MKNKKRVDRKLVLIISILLGYTGLDQLLIENKRRAISKGIAFFISATILILIDRVVKFIINTTTYSISFSRDFLQFVGAKSFLLQHFPRIVGLIILTFLVFAGLILTLTIIIWWIEDIIKIIEREK